MAATTGIAAIATYDGVTAGANVQKLIDLIANPDTTATSGAQAGGGYLDQMSPAAAVQLRVELTALKAAVDDWEEPT